MFVNSIKLKDYKYKETPGANSGDIAQTLCFLNSELQERDIERGGRQIDRKWGLGDGKTED